MRPAARSLLAALALASGGPVFLAPASPGAAGGWALAAQTREADRTEEALRDLVSAIARSWARGDASSVLASASDAGVRLHLGDGGSSPQPRKRAEAVLRRLLQDADGGRTSAGMVSVVGGSPERGFGELLWEAGAAGVPGVVRTVVYLGFEMEDDRWRLTEIRLL